MQSPAHLLIFKSGHGSKIRVIRATTHPQNDPNPRNCFALRYLFLWRSRLTTFRATTRPLHLLKVRSKIPPSRPAGQGVPHTFFGQRTSQSWDIEGFTLGERYCGSKRGLQRKRGQDLSGRRFPCIFGGWERSCPLFRCKPSKRHSFAASATWPTPRKSSSSAYSNTLVSAMGTCRSGLPLKRLLKSGGCS